MHEGDAVAALRLVQVVGGDDDRHPLAGHAVDQAPEAAAGEGIDAARGLVQEEHPRPMEHGAGEREPLLPAAGQRLRQEILLALETGGIDAPGHCSFQDRPRAGRRRPPKNWMFWRDPQVVVQAEPLRHVADAAVDLLGLPAHVHPEDAPRARGGRQQAAEASGWRWSCPRRCCRGGRRPRPRST